MMKRLSLTRSGMTLMELLITSVLVGIVTVGLIAAEQVVRMSRQSSARDNLVSTQMQAMMLALTTDISKTTGDYASTGIYLEDNPIPTVYLKSACFRYPYGDVNTYSDDRWSCWTFDMDSGILLSCSNLNAPVSDCTASPGVQDWSSIKYTKLAISVIDNTGNYIPSTGLVTNSSVAYIRVRIITRYDTNKDADPISNPDYKLESNISPVGLSR